MKRSRRSRSGTMKPSLFGLLTLYLVPAHLLENEVALVTITPRRGALQLAKFPTVRTQMAKREALRFRSMNDRSRLSVVDG